MDKGIDSKMRAAMAPIANKIAMMVAKAVVRLVNDAGGRQILQAEILQGELRDNIERAQNYGFTSNPLAGADAIIVCCGGAREQAIAIVVDDRRYRVNLQPGEVAIYDDRGNSIKLLESMVIVSAVDHLEATAPTTKITSNVTIDGNLTVNGDVETFGSLENNGHDVGSTHKHINSGGSGLGGVPQ